MIFLTEAINPVSFFVNCGKMLKGTLIADSGKVSCLDQDGKMTMQPVTLTPDQYETLQYPGLAE